MNASRTISTTVVASKSDIIAGLRAVYPDNISLQSLPNSGVGVTMSAGTLDVTLTFDSPTAALR